MKNEVKNISDCNEDVNERVIISRDKEYNGWVRDEWDHIMTLFSNCHGHCGDTIYINGKRVEAPSPYEEILDEDGYGTGEYKWKDDVVAFPVDVYEHSGMAWALSGEGGVCFSCPWDTARGAFVLYVTKEKWERTGYTEPFGSEEMVARARDIAREEIKEMNMCERGEWYSWAHEKRVRWTKKYEDGREEHGSEWEVIDSCSGYLTDEPIKDMDFPKTLPIYTDYEWLVGEEYGTSND